MGTGGLVPGPSLEELVQAARSPLAGERLRAAWALGERYPREVGCLPVLQAALQDPDGDVRGTAAEALGKLGARLAGAVEVLLGELRVEEAGDYRARVAYALGRAGPAAAPASPALVRLIRGGDKHARWAALWSLGEIGPEGSDVLPTLSTGLRDEAAANRFVAAWALGHIGAPAGEASAALRELAGDVHPLVAQTARWALSEVAPGHGLPDQAAGSIPAQAAGAVARLRSELVDAGRSRRLAAAWSAGELGPAAVALVPDLARLLKQGDAELQGAAAESLGKIGSGSPGAARTLARRLADDTCPVRAQIAYALGWMGPAARRHVGELLRFFRSCGGLSHRQIEARWATTCTLGLLRSVDPTLVTGLTDMLGDPESDIRFMAAESLGYLGAAGAGAVATLRRLAEDAHWTPRQRATWALARIGG